MALLTAEAEYVAFGSCWSQILWIRQQLKDFVKGQRIRENILLAQELFAGFHLDPYTPKCAVKVDF